MDYKQKRELLMSRYKALTDKEKQHMSDYAKYADSKFRHAVECEGFKELAEGYSDWFWEECILGKDYRSLKTQAERWVKDQQEFISLLEKVQKRKRWGSIRGFGFFKDQATRNLLTPFGVMCFIRTLGKADLSAWKCFSNKPKFQLGEMVRFRSNAGVDSVLQKHTYNTHSTYYGCGGHKLKEAKKKTYMIIEIEPELGGSCYATTYSYHEKQGGCRYYKVLPMGEAKTYFVVEKFLKKFRVPKCK